MHVIELINASIFQNNDSVLEKVNIKVAKGDFVFLIGRTGSGKSSLLKTLYAELPLKQGLGEVVDYQLFEIKKSIIPFLRRKIGIVFQDFELLNDRSVRDNLEFVLKATDWKDKQKINERIDEVLNEVGMMNLKNRMPYQLSGGEQQRISIARAILNKPNLILADEPTGNLDPGTSKEIMNLLIKINNQGSTILMATHDYDMISKFPKRTLRLEDGKLYELTKKT